MTDGKQPAGTDMDVTAWFGNLSKLLEKVPLQGIDLAAVVECQRKDMEALAEANRQAYEGIQALIARRNEMLQQAFAEWQAAVQNNADAEVVSRQAEAVKQGVEKAVSNFRELVEMEAQARNNAWKVVQDRVQENLANLQKLLQPK